MAEFLLAAGPLFLLALGGIDLARWMSVRQIIDVALLQAARAGAVQHADPIVMAAQFERALSPLFAGSSPTVTADRLRQALQRRRTALAGAPPWQIRILQPDAATYATFGTPGLAIARANGLPAINNHYQYEQHLLRQGNTPTPDTPQRSVFQANTLVLRLTYPHEPLLPGVAALLSHLGGATSGYTHQVFRAGLLPIVRVLRLDMASHPVDWPALPDGRIVKGTLAANNPSHGNGHETSAQACTSLWCVNTIRPLPTDTAEPVSPPPAPHPDVPPVPGETGNDVPSSTTPACP